MHLLVVPADVRELGPVAFARHHRNLMLATQHDRNRRLALEWREVSLARELRSATLELARLGDRLHEGRYSDAERSAAVRRFIAADKAAAT